LYSVANKKLFSGRKNIGGALAPLPLLPSPQITPMRHHINVGINIESNLACTALMYVTSGAPAAAAHQAVHLRDLTQFILDLKTN
jgi:hypothetical protein